MNYSETVNKYGSIRGAARALGVPYTTFHDNLAREKAARSTDEVALPAGVYVFTCAVRGAEVDMSFLANLEAYTKYRKGRLIIGAITNGAKARSTSFNLSDFPGALHPYITMAPHNISGGAMFCPELNIIPAMVKPLQGLATYTKSLWGIFPHPKVSLETVATHKLNPAKQIVTTGAVTKPFYSQTKAGHRAKFDHVMGAVVLEVDDLGIWIRHLIADDSAAFYDMDTYTSGGRTRKVDQTVQVAVYGDIHHEKLDEDVEKATWASSNNSLLHTVRPAVHFLHDLMDFTSINYHEQNNPFKRFHAKDDLTMETLEGALIEAANFVWRLSQTGPVFIVESNHDHFVTKWLLSNTPSSLDKTEDLIYYHKLSLALLEADPNTPVLKTVFDAFDIRLPDNCTILPEDDSAEFEGIEYGWHGHRGPNGSRAARAGFVYVTEKSVIGHLHAPSITSGCYVVGTSSKLDMGYNVGPSGWAHTHCLTYLNGTRTLVTMSDNRLWMDQKV